MKRILDFLDSLDFSLLGIMGIIGILTVLRLFLEDFSSPESSILFANTVTLVSYATLYAMLITLFTLRLAVLAKKPIMWSLRVMTLIFPVVIITPLIDLLFSKGAGMCVGYVQAGGRSLGWLFLHFLGPHGQVCGMTPGLRIQVIGGMVLISAIIFLLTKSWWRSLAGAIISYIISFIGGALPVIVNIITRTANHPTFESSTAQSLISSIHYPTTSLPFTANFATMTSFLLGRVQFLGLVIGIGFMWFYGSRSTWRAWWLGSFIKIPMVGVPLLMMIFGLMLGFGGFGGTYQLMWVDWLGIILVFLSLFFAAWSVGAINDIADTSIDAVSNPDYPMIKYGLRAEHMKTIQYVSLILALIGGYLVNYNALFCIVVFIGTYTFHSSSLLRLKRFWLTSSLCIVLANSAAFLAGFFTLSPDQSVGNFPLIILAMIAGLLFPYSIIKDIPDVAGDITQSLSTFPRLYGKRNTIITVLGLLVIWFIIFYKIIPWFFALAVVGTIVFFLLKPNLLMKKVLLFGVPTGLLLLGMIVHIII